MEALLSVELFLVGGGVVYLLRRRFLVKALSSVEVLFVSGGVVYVLMTIQIDKRYGAV